MRRGWWKFAARQASPMLHQLRPTCVALRDSDGDDVRLAVPLRLTLLDPELEGVSVCMARDDKKASPLQCWHRLFCARTIIPNLGFLIMVCALRNCGNALAPLSRHCLVCVHCGRATVSAVGAAGLLRQPTMLLVAVSEDEAVCDPVSLELCTRDNGHGSVSCSCFAVLGRLCS